MDDSVSSPAAPSPVPFSPRSPDFSGPDRPPPNPPVTGDLRASPAEGEGVSVAPDSAQKGEMNLDWVWREVRKRVFLKLPFSNSVADALQAVVPIAFDGDIFVVGLHPRHYPLTGQLTTAHVKNIIENILKAAAGRTIHLEVVEGVTLDDWHVVRDRRKRAHEAVVAMAQQHSQVHHFDDVLNQIVAEIRNRVLGTRDRLLPQVRAQLLFDVVPSLADAEDMLFPDPNAHEARRSMARALDRVAGFLDMQPFVLAVEVERYRRDHPASKPNVPSPQAPAEPAEASS
jgi:DNA-binding cell septation regulator SpoVG